MTTWLMLAQASGRHYRLSAGFKYSKRHRDFLRGRLAVTLLKRVTLALLKDADVLVLDGATSDSDTSLETRVHDDIESTDRDCLRFVVVHRLSTVQNADRIYAIEDREIVETGPSKELIATNRVYASLHKETVAVTPELNGVVTEIPRSSKSRI